jgi:hypothetical protein
MERAVPMTLFMQVSTLAALVSFILVSAIFLI